MSSGVPAEVESPKDDCAGSCFVRSVWKADSLPAFRSCAIGSFKNYSVVKFARKVNVNVGWFGSLVVTLAVFVISPL